MQQNLTLEEYLEGQMFVWKKFCKKQYLYMPILFGLLEFILLIVILSPRYPVLWKVSFSLFFSLLISKLAQFYYVFRAKNYFKKQYKANILDLQFQEIDIANLDFLGMTKLTCIYKLDKKNCIICPKRLVSLRKLEK